MDDETAGNSDDVFDYGELLHCLAEGALGTATDNPKRFSHVVLFDTMLDGVCRLDEEQEKEKVYSTLFDSGALSANYMSRRMFERLKCLLPRETMKKRRHHIRLADAVTEHVSDDVVELTLKFIGPNGMVKEYTGEFVVLQLESNDLIVGLPAMITHLWDFFVEAVESRSNSSPVTYPWQSSLNSMDDLRKPWASAPDGEEPEEIDSPLPVQFEYAHAFLGKPRVEAIKEYKDLWAEHVHPEFAKAEPVWELLGGKALEVFVPDNWEGIKGIKPLKINFRPDLPDRMKPKTRFINPRLYEAAEKEFKRLRGYFYEESRSPWASCLVMAPKATYPFIRFCGDYVEINKYIPTGHYYIPNVQYELDKIIMFKYFLDIDLTNAFHQIVLDPETAEKLSVQTPWGQFQPKFMPEGIGPGSGVLQETVRKIFEDFEDWCILMFDNALILAIDYQDAFQKLEKFIDRCIKHNVKLKFSKTWLGFEHVKFFGYDCEHTCYQLTDDRKKALMDIPFPTTGNRCKKMKSLMGVGVFFSPFVKNYTTHVAHLVDMTKPSFNWDEKTWKHNYRQEFEDFKLALQDSCKIFYPDYSLPWVLRTDASDYGVGAVLVQFFTREDGTVEEQVIAVTSKRFSEPATRWATIQKEGYGIFHGVHRFSYYLRGKEFIIETDHNNLQWMEASEVPMIVRWRIYLQSFPFQIRHIKGKNNVVADALSRLLMLHHVWLEDDIDTSTADHALATIQSVDVDELAPEQMDMLLLIHGDENDSLNGVFEKEELEEVVPTEVDPMQAEELFRQVHNGQQGHWGAEETWKRLNNLAPGHGLSIREVTELVKLCPNCQKNRRERASKLIPVARSLKPPHSRSAIGADSVMITPHGKQGEDHLLVVVNLFTKLTALYPAKGCTAQNLAQAIWSYWCTYGHTDMIISDKGSDFTSDLMRELTQLMGMRHVFSIVDKHSNGVERVNKEVVRHLRSMVFDRNVRDVFDDPTIIPSVQYILNTHVSSETGYSPFELTFGSMDKVYHEIFKDCTERPTHAFLQRLNENLKILCEASAQHQQALVRKRLPDESSPPQNLYKAGDLVLFDAGPKPNPKMASRHKGPFEVIRQRSNDVQVRDVNTGVVTEYSVGDLSPFFGSKNVAAQLALRDQEQHEVDCILSYRGNHDERYNCQFMVRFSDGDVRELTYTPDLRCEAFLNYCQSRRELYHITFDTALAKKFIRERNKQTISTVKPGDIAYVDLRVFGGRWYESLELPDWRNVTYVMEFQYTHWYMDKSFARNGYPDKNFSGTKTKISGKYILGGATDVWTTYKVWCFGETLNFDPSTMVLVSDELAATHPRILE